MNLSEMCPECGGFPEGEVPCPYCGYDARKSAKQRRAEKRAEARKLGFPT